MAEESRVERSTPSVGGRVARTDELDALESVALLGVECGLGLEVLGVDQVLLEPGVLDLQQNFLEVRLGNVESNQILRVQVHEVVYGIDALLGESLCILVGKVEAAQEVGDIDDWLSIDFFTDRLCF